MSKVMKSTVVATVAVFAASVVAELMVNRMAYGKSSPYHLASIASGMIVASTFFFWRLIAGRCKDKVEQSCQMCKMISHKAKQHLQVIMYYADIHDAEKIKNEARSIADLVDEPVRALGGVVATKQWIADHNKRALAARAGV